MKYIKKVLLLVLFFCLTQWSALSIKASDMGLSYSSIASLPTLLPEDTDFTLQPSYPAYQEEGDTKLLKQVLMGKCLMTFSVPELEGLDAVDYGEENQLLLVTAEYYEKKQGETIAKAFLYVFNSSEQPKLSIHSNDGDVVVEMTPHIVEIVLASEEGKSSKLWTDSLTKKSTKTAVYQSASAGMSDFAGDGWYYEKVDDVTFSYDKVDLPYDMRKYLTEYVFDYKEYLEYKQAKATWYNSFGTYWLDSSYSTFDLDAYAQSLGASVIPANSKCDKEYILNGNVIKLGYTGVEWDPCNSKSASSSCLFTPCFNYFTRQSDSCPVKVGEHLSVERWNFDFAISLLNFCATQ